MKALLMHRDRDFDPGADLPPNAEDLTQDLELDTLFGAMAAGDPFLLGVARSGVLASLHDPEAIVYRQRVLADCLRHPDVVRELYAIAEEAVLREKKIWAGVFGDRYPEGLLHRSVQVLQLFMGLMRRIRLIADVQRAQFESEGFAAFFAMIEHELDDTYLASIEQHLKTLEFREGVLVSAQLGTGNKGTRYVLRSPRPRRGWKDRILPDRTGYVWQLPDRDEAGARAMAELRDRGVSQVAIALAQSTDHILSFFTMLRTELGFYVSCLNLRDRLAATGQATCFPAVSSGEPVLSGRGLYDVALALTTDDEVVGNDLDADGRLLVMVTGANRGGKSTFLRSVGLAQLMTQSGMFVGAANFRANASAGVFTHFKREEDATMTSGKLDEELIRMRAVIGQVTRGSLVLLNESFASTNEREGSEIARQIVRALVDSGVKVCYVTHLFDLAHGFYREPPGPALFLRAERQVDGTRTFRVLEGEPLPTSYGEDVYRQVFGVAPGAAAATAAASPA
jgi:hypothetical protein